MDKKFYMIPEAEVIDLELKNAIMVISVDEEDPGILPGEGDTGDLG
jgi:hypothetical protein